MHVLFFISQAMDKSEDAPLSRNEFVKILLSTPSNCELRCQVSENKKLSPVLPLLLDMYNKDLAIYMINFLDKLA